MRAARLAAAASPAAVVAARIAHLDHQIVAAGMLDLDSSDYDELVLRQQTPLPASTDELSLLQDQLEYWEGVAYTKYDALRMNLPGNCTTAI
jgi:hypothetical protein